MAELSSTASTPSSIANATSLAAPKAVEAGAASLLVEDDDQLGAAAFVVLLNAEGALVAQAQTTVGG